MERLIAYNPAILTFPNHKNELLWETANEKFRSLLEPRVSSEAEFLNSLQKKPVYFILGHGTLLTDLAMKKPDFTRVPEKCEFLNFAAPGELMHASAVMTYFIEKPSFADRSIRPLFAVRDSTELYGIAKAYTVKSTNFANNELGFTLSEGSYQFNPTQEAIQRHIRTHPFRGAFSQLESFYRVATNFAMNDFWIVFKDELFKMGVYRYHAGDVQFLEPPKERMYLSEIFQWISEKEPEGALIASYACSEVKEVEALKENAQTEAMHRSEELSYANEMRFRELYPVVSRDTAGWSLFRAAFPTVEMPVFLFDLEHEMRVGFFNPSEENMMAPHRKLNRANVAHGFPPLPTLPRTSLSKFAQMQWNKATKF